MPYIFEASTETIQGQTCCEFRGRFVVICPLLKAVAHQGHRN